MKKALFSLLAATIAAALPVHAATFVKDVMLIGGNESETTALKTSYAAQGWTVIDQDLNAGAGGDYIYLLCKTEANPDNVNDGYITDFVVYTEGGTVPDSQTYDGRTYHLAPCAGGQHFTERQGDLNSNAGGASIHLYYTTDAFPDDRAVVDVWFSSSSSGAVGKFGETDGYDLNQDANGDDIYMHAPAAPHGATLTVNGSPFTRGGAGWSYSGGTVTLSGAGPFVLSTGGTAFTNGVGIVAAANCAVTFSNLVMDVSANKYLSPFTVTPGTETALTLVEKNSLAAGESAAGLAVVSNDTAVAALVIGAADTNQTLTAMGGDKGAGIGGGRNDDGGTVTINGGAVSATGGTYGAGIGGGEYGSGGTVTINGGSVTATGGTDGAGIGGGDRGSGGTVTINGGSVTATGGYSGAGIGGGDRGSGGTVAINGGSVTATGGDHGAGIGGGLDGSGGAVAINGGSVTATGGAYAAGIGGGHHCDADGSLAIGDEMKVGYVDASGNVISWASPGERAARCRTLGVAVRIEACDPHEYGEKGLCAHCRALGPVISYVDPAGGTNAFCGAYTRCTNQTTLTSGWYAVAGDVTIGTRIVVNGDVNLILADGASLTAKMGIAVGVKSGATNSLTVWAQSVGENMGRLTVEGYGPDAGIGGGYGVSCGAVTVNGGAVTAEGGLTAAGIGGGDGGSGGTVAINGGSVTAIGITTAGIGSGGGGSGGTVTIKPAAGFMMDVAGGDDEGNAAPIVGSPFTAETDIASLLSGKRFVKTRSFLRYLDPTDPDNPVKVCDDCAFYAGQTTLTSGWYLLTGDITNDTRIVVDGDAHLILADGATLTANRGIGVTRGNSLRVWAQSDGANMGRLTATGGEYAAGIGGGRNDDGGTVAINGGTVAAQGGDHAAGIGGGEYGSGGTLTINGGVVSATGGLSAAGIGGGYEGAGGTVTINGGTVKAEGGDQLVAGISGGEGGSGGTNTFTGGSILAASVVGAPSNGVARVWPVAVAGLADGETPSLPWLPATYGTNGLVAVGGEVCVWLPTGAYAYGEVESDGAGGMRRHAVLVDAEGNVTLDGWVAVPPLGLTVNGRDIAFESGEGWTVDGGHVVLSGPGPFVLSTGGATFTNDIGIVAAADCAVTFSNLVMDVSANNYISPFTVTPGTETALTLVGTNSLAAGESAAGLAVVSNDTAVAALVIDAADTNQTLSATGGQNGSGIGGGVECPGGIVAINGGVVTATGGDYGAGIGGGKECSGGTVTINNGTVTATGGFGSACIGGGYYGSVGTVTINGGMVTATGGRFGAGGIGAGFEGGGGGLVTISGGTVVATASRADYGDFGGRSGLGDTVTFTGGSIRAAHGNVWNAPSNGVARVWCVTVKYLTPCAAVAFSGLPAGYGTDDIFADGSGQAYLWLPNGDYEFTANGKDYHVSVEDANATARHWFGLMVNGSDIAFESGEGWTFDGATVSLTNAGPFVLSTGGATFTDDVGIVAATDCAVTFSNLDVFAGNHAGLSPFTVAPGVSVALTLEGNTVLTAGSGAAAITVVSNATGVASLMIDADASDTFHTLGANGGGQGAGIGGGDGEACGSVTILGGLLTVEGGANAAGIGGGRNGAGGAVTIFGGRLSVKSAGSYAFIGGKLTSVNGGAAIGGGYQAAGGSTAISGGTVWLTGVGGGAAVGPGKDGAGGTTAITGGSILARGGAVEPSPSNGVARVWPVSVTGLADSAAPSLPWLPATYGTNDFVAVGGEVCVWLPTGGYPYGEPESDGAGGMRRHAVLVDAEGNVTLDGWVAVSALSSLTITGFALAPDGTATIAFSGDGDLAAVSDSLAVDVSATPDFATLLAPASTNLAITGATGTFTVSPPASAPPTLFFRVRVP